MKRSFFHSFSLLKVIKKVKGILLLSPLRERERATSIAIVIYWKSENQGRKSRKSKELILKNEVEQNKSDNFTWDKKEKLKLENEQFDSAANQNYFEFWVHQQYFRKLYLSMIIK